MRSERARTRGAFAITVAAVAAALAVCAGCTSSAAPARPAKTPATSRAAAPSVTATPSPSVPPVALPSRALASPGCSTATAASPALGSVRTAMAGVSGNPFGVAVPPGGGWAFVGVGGSIEVWHATGSGAPVLFGNIPVPGGAVGLTISPDGQYLLAADGTGAVVVSVTRALLGQAGAVLGQLTAPAAGGAGDSAIEVAVSPDDRFAFVTLEYARRAVVFNLGRALSRGFGPADYVGAIPLGQAAVGMAVSPDGRWLYATSELGPAALPPATGGTKSSEPPGTLSVINLRRAETDPASSVVARVDAGCEPVRVITSADGTQVWVTARASDDLLCFSAARLAADPRRALVAIVRVGEAPVGLAAVSGGSQIVVADSNRFRSNGARSDLDVVNVAAALAQRPAVVGHIKAGLFPREMALLPDGTLLVSDFASDQLEAVDLAGIPGG
jgi:DNA-binding beta-propeller fold protein YncE